MGWSIGAAIARFILSMQKRDVTRVEEQCPININLLGVPEEADGDGVPGVDEDAGDEVLGAVEAEAREAVVAAVVLRREEPRVLSLIHI